MFTKAKIIKTPDTGSTEYVVSIPLFQDNTGKDMLFNALLCNQPGEFNAYKVGDTVFVEFEGDTLNFPVIVGKLYTGVEKSSDAYHIVNQLNVTTKAILPDDTTIAGYGRDDFFNWDQRVTNLESGETGGIKYIEIGTWGE